MPISPSSKSRPCKQGRDKPTILITMGDPSGIGPEVTLKALASPGVRRLADFFVIGDRKYKSAGRASMEYLKAALAILRKKKNVGLVTGPISKEAINRAGFHYDGHTEFLAKETNSAKVAMMLIGGPLRVTLVTRHIPLKDVHKKINRKKIIDTIELTHDFLTGYLKKRYPKIAVASLNPHAGEGGIFGDEEKRIISPAVAKAKRKYKNVYGPVASDAVFYDAYKGRVDAVICMYHDQGLIPLKMIARDTGVNVTLGLPFVRTSPDHGTAFDIAGKGKANPSSMIEAIKMAAKLIKMRC